MQNVLLFFLEDVNYEIFFSSLLDIKKAKGIPFPIYWFAELDTQAGKRMSLLDLVKQHQILKQREVEKQQNVG